MRTVSLLLYLYRKVASAMGSFILGPLRAGCEWLWRRLCVIWRCFVSTFRPIVGYALLAIRGGGDHGRRRGEEPGEEGQPAARGHEGQYGAMGGEERPPAREREPGRCEEELYTSDSSCEDPDPSRGEMEEDSDGEACRVEATDELYCGYDSTWEVEESHAHAARGSRRPAGSRHQYKFSRFENASRDMQNYRHGYPNILHHRTFSESEDMPNLNFYLGRTCSVPDGASIHDFHTDWFGDYHVLEHVHTYIQWLFPLQEPGMNFEAKPLRKEEIKCFLENNTAKRNLLQSYMLMLDFYGIEMCDVTTGEVKKANNWRDRFYNLNTNTHNNLRITRILKCLGTLGYRHYQAPLVHFFLEETLVNRQLPNVKDSVLNYFVFAVLDKNERRRLIKFAYLNYDRKDEFVWCPKKIQMKWSRLPSAQVSKWSY